jgi:hypothetical protein
MAANHWYSSDTDHGHLSVAGYRTWGQAVVRVLQRAIDPADLNDDRQNTVGDLFIFIQDWFGRTGQGDFNRDGAYEVDDLFRYLDAYFAGG